MRFGGLQDTPRQPAPCCDDTRVAQVVIQYLKGRERRLQRELAASRADGRREARRPPRRPAGGPAGACCPRWSGRLVAHAWLLRREIGRNCEKRAAAKDRP